MMPRTNPVIASPWPPRWGCALIAFSDFSPSYQARRVRIGPAVGTASAAIAHDCRAPSRSWRGFLGRIHTGFGGIGTCESWFGGNAGKGAGGMASGPGGWVTGWVLGSASRRSGWRKRCSAGSRHAGTVVRSL
jgi:hypothetical protein